MYMYAQMCRPVCVCLEVSISNVIPESLDICPQLHLKQISQSLGITLLIHTHTHTPPDRLVITSTSIISLLKNILSMLSIALRMCLAAGSLFTSICMF